MNPEKLRIVPRSPSQLKEIEVLFNPNTYTMEKTVAWGPALDDYDDQTGTMRALNAPSLTFGGGGSRQLTFDLFFDVSESLNPRKDVRDETNRIFELTQIMRDKEHPYPPICELFWGNQPLGAKFPFVGVVVQLTQRFTLFRGTGEPVRAVLTVVFLEHLEAVKDKRQTDPELTTRVVKRGDTLQGLSAELLRDPALWRLIAEANRIDDPRHLEIGRVLTIPKVS